MDAVQLAHALGGSGTGINSGLDSAHVAADHNGDQTGADLHLADQMDVSSLDHSISGLDGADQAAGLDHTKSFFHNKNLRK